MKKRAIIFTLTILMTASWGVALACEYKKGETKFIDYANCRYGEDAILVVDTQL